MGGKIDTVEYGYDCVGLVYYSFLKEEIGFFRNELSKRKISLNGNGLFNSVEDVKKIHQIKTRKYIFRHEFRRLLGRNADKNKQSNDIM